MDQLLRQLVAHQLMPSLVCTSAPHSSAPSLLTPMTQTSSDSTPLHPRVNASLRACVVHLHYVLMRQECVAVLRKAAAHTRYKGNATHYKYYT
ncbi:hypothetical protein RJ55_03018 [Drechmeria coniospora]|nr:hypothetical protein RJ55_03018 [Drechmeria coniospora]